MSGTAHLLNEVGLAAVVDEASHVAEELGIHTPPCHDTPPPHTMTTNPGSKHHTPLAGGLPCSISICRMVVVQMRLASASASTLRDEDPFTMGRHRRRMPPPPPWRTRSTGIASRWPEAAALLESKEACCSHQTGPSDHSQARRHSYLELPVGGHRPPLSHLISTRELSTGRNLPRVGFAGRGLSCGVLWQMVAVVLELVAVLQVGLLQTLRQAGRGAKAMSERAGGGARLPVALGLTSLAMSAANMSSAKRYSSPCTRPRSSACASGSSYASPRHKTPCHTRVSNSGLAPMAPVLPLLTSPT